MFPGLSNNPHGDYSCHWDLNSLPPVSNMASWEIPEL
jgi:hypothetical protein